MARIAKNTPRGPDNRPLRIRCTESAEQYLRAFFTNQTEHKGGFGRYMTVNGYSSSKFVMGQPNQALIKAGLAALRVLQERAVQGDSEAQKLVQIMQVTGGEKATCIEPRPWPKMAS